MANGIKVIFETHRGERVERTLKAIWSSECCLDLKAFHSDNVGEEMKSIVAQEIASSLSKDLVLEMLTELEQTAFKQPANGAT
jgi:hypothetical protein